jgi:hypothetical protein
VESCVVTLTSLNRWQASAIHLGISAAIGIGVVVLMLALWYPQHYFAAMGGDTLIMLLIGVDVVIGPLITLIIFDPKKKNLRFDLAVIALLQSAALVYGCSIMFKARPVYNVFVVDRFEVIARECGRRANRARRRSRHSSRCRSRSEARRCAGADRSQATSGHRDVGSRWRQRSVQSCPTCSFLRRREGARGPGGEAARRARPAPAAGSRRSSSRSSRRPAAPRMRSDILPMKARNRDMAVVVDRKTGDIVGIVPVNPW